MHSIQLPDDQYAKLTEKAQAAGYGDVTAFMKALAGEPATDPRGTLSEAELRESAAECAEALAEIKANGGRDFREALLELGRERGFPLPE